MCAKDICEVLNSVGEYSVQQDKKKNYDSLFKKYAMSIHCRVSKIPERLQAQKYASQNDEPMH